MICESVIFTSLWGSASWYWQSWIERVKENINFRQENILVIYFKSHLLPGRPYFLSPCVSVLFVIFIIILIRRLKTPQLWCGSVSTATDEIDVSNSLRAIYKWNQRTRWPGAVPQSINCIRLNDINRLSYYNIKTSLVDLDNLCWLKQNILC